MLTLCCGGVMGVLTLLRRADWFGWIMVGVMYAVFIVRGVAIHETPAGVAYIYGISTGIAFLRAGRNHPKAYRLERWFKSQDSRLFDILGYEIPYSHKLVPAKPKNNVGASPSRVALS